jgi:hypothetical protein
MRLESRITNGLRNLMNKPRAEAQLDDELRAYVELVTDEKVAAGISPAEARRSTLAELGGVEQVKQAVREERFGAGLELLAQDFRYSLRRLRKSRGFSLAAVLTLALGIGTTAAMFSVVDAVILRPLPYNNLDRIVDVKTHSASAFWQVCSWPGYLEMTLEQQKDTGSLSVCLFVRTSVPPAAIIGQLRQALHEVAPAVAFQTPSTMDDLLEDALVTNRMEGWLFGIFAGISILLAAVGVQGLLTQEVTSRTRDIGVRMALGASRAMVVQMMLKRIAFLLAIGLGAGMGIVFLLHRVVASVIAVQFERDGAAMAALALLLGAIGLAAAIPPTRRAALIDPVQTLRME